MVALAGGNDIKCADYATFGTKQLSKNIIHALNVANAKSMKSYAILGFDGGKCKDLATVPIHFEVNDMLISEDIQMIVFNICFQWIVKTKNK